MKTKYLPIILLLSINTFAQNKEQDWSAFRQTFEVKDYRGGEFKLTAYVKVESANPRISQARLWARVDLVKGIGFFDNMYDRPISLNEWKMYSIEGVIDNKAEKLTFGGLYFGVGKYSYDKFELKIKKKNGQWQTASIANSDFEKDDFMNSPDPFHGSVDRGWYHGKDDGFVYGLENGYEGKSFVIDGTSKLKKGKFVNTNGIDFYYETHGQGDTVLLLHGNGQSIKAFSKQIPEFEKQFTVLAIDSRAQGYSSDDGQKLTYDLMAEDVNSILNQLKIKNINVLGWSDGGNTGLILAMKHPEKVKRLATMGANLFCDESSVDGKIIRSLTKQKEEMTKKKTASTDYQLRMATLLLEEPKINPDDLKVINCPVLVMAGSKDVIKENHTKLIASKIPNSKLVILKNSTHYAPQENPEVFNQEVIEFFSGKN